MAPLCKADIDNSKILRKLDLEEAASAIDEVDQGVTESEQILKSVAAKLQAASDVAARFRLCYDVCHTLLVCKLKTEGYVVDTGINGGHRVGLFTLYEKLAPPSKPEFKDWLLAAHFARNRKSYGASKSATASSNLSPTTMAQQIEAVAKDIFDEVAKDLRKWVIQRRSQPASVPVAAKKPKSI